MKKNNSDRKQVNITLKTPKKKKWVTVVAVIVILWIIGVAIGGENDDKKKSSAEKILDANTDIVWKDEDNMGIANLKLDGNHTKELIKLEYFEEVAAYINDLDKTTLKDYHYVEFKGNVMRDGKIECTILGNLSIDYIKSSDDISGVEVENSITDLRIPKPLQ